MAAAGCSSLVTLTLPNLLPYPPILIQNRNQATIAQQQFQIWPLIEPKSLNHKAPVIVSALAENALAPADSSPFGLNRLVVPFSVSESVLGCA